MSQDDLQSADEVDEDVDAEDAEDAVESVDTVERENSSEFEDAEDVEEAVDACSFFINGVCYTSPESYELGKCFSAFERNLFDI